MIQQKKSHIVKGIITSENETASSDYRKLTRLIFVLVLLAIIYLTSAPFEIDFSKEGFIKQWNRAELVLLQNNRGDRLSLPDMISNILIFIPVGFWLHGLLISRRNGQVKILTTVALGALLSLSVELFQFLLPVRFPSVNDLFNNSLGTLIGAGLARKYFIAFMKKLVATVRLLIEKPAWLMLAMLCLNYALWMSAPFDYTSWLTGIFIKWQHLKNSFEYLASLDQSLLDASERFYWPFVAMENYFYGIVLGTLAIFCYNRYWLPSKKARVTLPAILAFVLLAIHGNQLIVKGSSPDALQFITVALGLVSAYGTLSLFQKLFFTPIATNRIALRTTIFFYLCFFLLVIVEARANTSMNSFANSSRAFVGFTSLLFDSISLKSLASDGAYTTQILVKHFLATLPVVFIITKFLRHHISDRHSKLRGLLMKSFLATVKGSDLKRNGLKVEYFNICLLAAIAGFSFALMVQFSRYYFFHFPPHFASVVAITASCACAIWLESRSYRDGFLLQQKPKNLGNKFSLEE